MPASTVRHRARGRPPVISTERMLEVAREVFLEHGIRATTAEVAARAGISEGTIFHRFHSKEELFRAAMSFEPEAAVTLVEELAQSAGDGEPRPVLVRFAERFMDLTRVALPVMLMSWSNPDGAVATERGAERLARYQRIIGSLSSYFAREMELGRVRHADADALARVLVGSLQHFCLNELLAGETNNPSSNEFAARAVDVVLGAA